jgi:hypothetical protein
MSNPSIDSAASAESEKQIRDLTVDKTQLEQKIQKDQTTF